MLPAAEERISALGSGEEIFSLAAGVALAALDTHQGAREAQGKKTHQGIFSKNRALRVGEIWAKWSGTHQDRKCSWSKAVLGSALDDNGNTLTDASGKGYTWDFENRLVQAVVPGTGGGTTTFKYDPFGRRIQKAGPLGTTNYLYDGDNLLEEVDSSGNSLARYGQTTNMDEPLSQFRGTSTSYFEADGLGTITSLSNAGGTLTQTYTFDSFGDQTASAGSLTEPFRYTARELDAETNLYYYRARYYDETVGRFLSEDPIGLAGGINFFSYVGNSPVNFIDPLGLRLICTQNRTGQTTVMTCVDTTDGTTTTYNVTENANSGDPNNPYGPNGLLPPGDYELQPRLGPGTVFHPGDPQYTTPGQATGVVIAPHGERRTAIGPHRGRRSNGCPLFAPTPEGIRQRDDFYRRFRNNVRQGGTTVTVQEVPNARH